MTIDRLSAIVSHGFSNRPPLLMPDQKRADSDPFGLTARAHELLRGVAEEFVHRRAAVRSDSKLTAEGQVAAMVEAAKEAHLEIGSIRASDLVTKLRAATHRVQKRIADTTPARSDDPATVLRQREYRDLFRALDAQGQRRELHRVVTDGDKLALAALLDGPNLGTPDSETRSRLRLDFIRVQEPMLVKEAEQSEQGHWHVG